MFANPCVGDLGYEAVSTAIAMSGIFLSFIVEYAGDRYIQTREKLTKTDGAIAGVSSKEDPDHPSETSITREPVEDANHRGITVHGSHGHVFGKDDKVSVLVMEAGIIFHSICEYSLHTCSL